MSNISKVELITSDLAYIGFAKSGVFSALAWGYAFSLAHTVALQERVFDPHDPEFGRLFKDAKQQRMDGLLAREERLADILAWVSSEASVDILPSGEDVAKRMQEDAPSAETDEALVENYATAKGISLEAAYKLYARDDVERQKRAQLQKDAAQRAFDRIRDTVDRALSAYCPGDLELSDRDAVRILEKVAEKCELYADQKDQQSRTTRRKRRQNNLLAEVALLEKIMDRADETIERIQLQLDGQFLDKEPVEERSTESAPDDHGDVAEAI